VVDLKHRWKELTAIALQQRFAPGEGVVGDVAATGKALRVPDAQAAGILHPTVCDPVRRHAMLLVPLTLRDEVVGVMVVLNKRSMDEFSEEDQFLLAALSEQAVFFIDNARMVAALATQERVRRELQIARDAANDIHPPIYYWILHFWAKFVGYGEFPMRFVSAAAGVLAVCLAYKVGRRLFSPGAGLVGPAAPDVRIGCLAGVHHQRSRDFGAQVERAAVSVPGFHLCHGRFLSQPGRSNSCPARHPRCGHGVVRLSGFFPGRQPAGRKDQPGRRVRTRYPDRAGLEWVLALADPIQASSIFSGSIKPLYSVINRFINARDLEKSCTIFLQQFTAVHFFQIVLIPA
jgi:hypothetical protein